MWLTEGCGGRRHAVATPNRESQKEKKIEYVIRRALVAQWVVLLSHLSGLLSIPVHIQFI